MNGVLCFGELLLRLSPQLGGEWIKQSAIPVFVGGAELNTATALACWGEAVSYCTALPDNYLSKEIISEIDRRGINAASIHFSGARIGTYYLPQGTDLKSAGVIYDRAYSSFSELQRGQINWNEIFRDVSWFHFSAISPALNANIAAICLEAVKAASQKGITISVDLNYRSKLWQWGAQPSDVMPELVQYCDVIMGNVWAEEAMLGIPVDPNLSDTKEAYLEQSRMSSKAIMAAFPKCRQVANTFRFDESEGVRYYATLFANDQLAVAPEQHTAFIVDKIGSGDTFMGGLIYGNRKGWDAQQTVDFAAAAAFNKLFIKGDATTATIAQINKSFSTHV
jgi:2-dehydro-3-deoxygluconokinase